MKKVAGEHFDPALSTFFRHMPISNCLPIVECDGKQYLQVATNDYLGLATHPEVIKAETEVTQEHGLGTPLGARPLTCLLYTSPSPRDRTRSRMPSSA